MRKFLIYLLASIPFITLVFAIPFVNRIEPMIWGMPFLLWWIVVNVSLTPLWLRLIFQIEKHAKTAASYSQRKEVSK